MNPRTSLLIAASSCFTLQAHAGDWPNSGGNSQRNGRTIQVGPSAPTLAWSGAPSSIIAWQPVIEGNRVFMVRQTGFPPEPFSDESPIVCKDLTTGATLWTIDLPFNTGDWTTWIAGVHGGRVYASRSGNGASVQAKLHCLDAATGTTLWTSADKIDAGAYDGVVFAPDGDPVVASFTTIKRIESLDGSTVWTSPRLCSVSGECGAALHGDAIYVADAAVGGHVIKRHDLATGIFQYQSPVMTGFTLQNTPMLGPDGTIYLSRTQNNTFTDYFYALADSGGAITIKWSVACGWSTTSEFAVGYDGSVYALGFNHRLVRLDPVTGAALNASAPLAMENVAPRMAADPLGGLYVSNGGFAEGKFFAFNADLSLRWSTIVPNINIGAPAIGKDGTLVIAGIGSDVRAYRTPRTLNGDPSEISAASGGTQSLSLDAGAAHAGELYLLLGTLSSTLPGTPVPPFSLPLNVDGYTLYTLSSPNSGLLSGSLGFLDASGHAAASFNLPAALSVPGLPLTVFHAYLALDLGSGAVSLVSNPLGVSIGP